ncbi:hypothetical protein [Adhaeribacter radiodurans]|uniref:Uncharacterized protein n=1 Tax=Adhaeribacter radiodurans TaxID=2745197 RepID=A0A7L7LC52_9BACT|nr:hypothetical protein [Adhaeribacter radiodurans]QMU30416.1 hypothetical protein HUW48_21385 [Adhaeribacter radiodurans]
MSIRLIDWIFQNLDFKSLDRSAVLNHLIYLNEITQQETSLDRIVKYYSYKISLENRLVQLDKELVDSIKISPESKSTLQQSALKRMVVG